MRNTQGFFFIELIMYIFLVSFFSVVLIQGVAQRFRQLDTARKKVSLLRSLHMMSLVLIRDIQGAPVAKKEWKKATAHECIWSTPTGDIGWLYANHALYRLKGAYDSTAEKWRKKTTNCVMANVQEANFSITNQGSLVDDCLLRLTVGDSGHSIRKEVRVKSRGMVRV